MPNGHGGIPRFGSPVALAIVVAVLLRARVGLGWSWTVYPAIAVAGLIGWRLSWHLFLYPLMEYGGSYSSVEQLERAERRHRMATALLVPIGGAVAWMLWP